MTIEEFLAFTETRPDEERWELIEGVPVEETSLSSTHQIVLANLVTFLMNRKAEASASWMPLLGIGIQVPASPNSLPMPDAYVQAGPASWAQVTIDALAVFEVLTKSNTAADQAWRRKVYASVPNCQHYVTVSLKAAAVVAYDRSSGWKSRQVSGLDATLDLPALGLALPLVDVYRYTPVGE